ncbi:OprO/OprP family phosphate-selective porin [Candidatus Nitrotoga arctica]|uniref:OprO/OprP family phosphate-selective porin n=1 Tax=Candidatus Nitrotoga arctica TaxID=453162 RepID=UPI001EFA9788|nr:OprO/OprP family phosphate-selective porin [Candidatus Nitrotoga arctica]
MLWTTFAHAIDLMGSELQLHGFLTQGVVITSDNNFLGQSNKKASTDFREIGVNASLRPTSDLQLSAGLLSHKAGATDNGEVRLDYGLIDWTASSNEQGRSGIRLGRLKNSFGLYNKTRDVAFTRPSILLPQSIYFERTRNLTIAGDGAELYIDRNYEAGNLFVTLALGKPQIGSEASKVALVGLTPNGSFESKLVPIFQVIYEGDGGKYRLGFTAVHFDASYNPGVRDVLQAGQLKYTPKIFSAQYNAESWSVTSEYALRPVSTRNFGPNSPDAFNDGQSYYVQGSYRLAPKWEALLRYDVTYIDRGDRDGKAFAAATHLPSFTRFSKDWTAGVRFDLTPEFMLRAEYHRVDGTGYLPVQDNPNPRTLERRWDMFMLLASFRF